MDKLDASTRGRLEANIFPAAHQAVIESFGAWDLYPWHRSRNGIDAWQNNSSQALSIDIFGTIKAFENRASRDAVMNAISAEVGMEADHAWKIKLEWTHKENTLRERRRTQVDVIAKGQNNLILMECKFTEQDGGSCSQIKTLQDETLEGKPQCDGRYRLQTNPLNNVQAECALSGKGIQYWNLIPHIFDLNSLRKKEECVFRGSWFQWMRNLVLCKELARTSNQRTKFVVVYVDSPKMPFRQKLASSDWVEFLGALYDKTIIGILSYERILELGINSLKPFENEWQTWVALKAHVKSKIAAVESGR